MSLGSNTRPEHIIDKNGKANIVHKGRATTNKSISSSRAANVSVPPKSDKITPQPLAKGSTFHATYADGRPKYHIVSVQGDVVKAISEDMDYGGLIRLFTRDQALYGLQYEANLQNSFNATDDFWNSRVNGEIVHYHDGFGKFVRGEIITNSRGEKVMSPIALIGDWGNDVVGRNPRGVIYYNHHASKIINGGEDSAWAPHQGNVWESMSENEKASPKYDFIRNAGGDISTIAPISLEAPEITPEKQNQYDVYNAETKLSSTIADYGMNPKERIAAARTALDELEALYNKSA